MSTPKDGGSAFPTGQQHDECGLSIRDYFAIRAPEASESWIQMQSESDKARNPHGDSYRPKRRSVEELRAEWRYQFADAMLHAREAGE